MRSRKYLRAEQVPLVWDGPGLVAGVDEAGRGPLSLPIGGVPSSRRIFSFRWQPTSRDPFDLTPGVPSLVPVETTPRKEGLLKPHRPWRVVVGRTSFNGALTSPGPENWYLALRVADGTGPSSRARAVIAGTSKCRRSAAGTSSSR